MLTQNQIKEIKEHLEKAQNPLFFFDNDQDGLCSFLLLQKYIQRGKGVPIKTFPDLNITYFRKVDELNPDYIFILDKPIVSKEFLNEIHKLNLPIVWIDHHEIDKKTIPDFVNYYNPLFNNPPENPPVTALCHQINSKKQDLWIAVIGCIADRYLPNFYQEFKKQFPELTINSSKPFEILYNSEIGKTTRMLGFGLKDRTTNVINMLKLLISAKSPYDILTETNKNKSIHAKYNELNEKYIKLLKKAKELNSEKIIFFEYGGDLSISSDLANQLTYEFPEKIIFVIYKKGIKANISARGKNIKKSVSKVINEIPEATGGGHEDAIGARINIKDLDIFKEKIKNILKHRKL